MTRWSGPRVDRVKIVSLISPDGTSAAQSPARSLCQLIVTIRNHTRKKFPSMHEPLRVTFSTRASPKPHRSGGNFRASDGRHISLAGSDLMHRGEHPALAGSFQPASMTTYQAAEGTQSVSESTKWGRELHRDRR